MCRPKRQWYEVRLVVDVVVVVLAFLVVLPRACRGVVVSLCGSVVENFGLSDADAGGGVLGALAGMAA